MAMEGTVTLKPMTKEMYHAFFREYQNDADLYLNKNDFVEYRYEKSKVDAYIQRQMDLKRLPFAIVYGDELVGEVRLYDIEQGKSAALGITMKSKRYKDRGFGTQAERLAIRYAFYVLDVPTVYADSVLTNTRSQHVLEKVGFQLVREDKERKYYRITRPEQLPHGP